MPEIKKPDKAMKACYICGVRGVDFPLLEYWHDDRVPRNRRRVCHECQKDRLDDELIACVDCDAVYWYLNVPHEITLQWPQADSKCPTCRVKHMEETPPKPIRHCKRCESAYVSDDPEQLLCNSCTRIYTECPVCKEDYAKKNGIGCYVEKVGSPRTNRVHLCCDSCAEKLMFSCKVCRNRIERDSNIPSHKEEVCQECKKHAKHCGACGELGHPDHGGNGLDLNLTLSWFCDSCCRYLYRCESCGEYVIYTGAEYHKHHNRAKKCIACIGWPVQPHNFKRPPKFYGEGPLYYGVENEIEFHKPEYVQMTDALRAWAAEPHRREKFHITHDGTLKFGVELVSMPMSFDYWMAQKPDELFPENIPNRVVYETAGCHIHVSRDAFTAAHLMKFLVFLNDNFEYFLRVFGRGLGDYCRECPANLHDYAEFMEKLQPDYDDKYWWVNMKSGKTVELRIFKAAEDWPTLQSYLQLLDSVYHYTKDKTPNELKWKDYYRYINKEEKYFILADCLEKRPPIDGAVPAKAEDIPRLVKGEDKIGPAQLYVPRPQQLRRRIAPDNLFDEWVAGQHEMPAMVADDIFDDDF